MKHQLSESAPHLETFTLGPFETNCYVITPHTPRYWAQSKQEERMPCWVVDASFTPGLLIKYIHNNDLQPVFLLLTHAHIDHIAGIREVLAAFPGLPIAIHEAERAWLGDPLLNLSSFSGQQVTAPEADRLLRHGDRLELGGQSWEVRHTPGHSPGGISLYHAGSGQAVVGDALFAGSIGRTDFPGSSHEVLAMSIREQLYTLPAETVIYPGHGPTSTIGREKMSNPFVRAQDQSR